MNTDQEKVLDGIRELIDEISNPPLNPTLTKDELLYKLRGLYDTLNDESFYSIVTEGSDIDSTDLTDIRDDIDEAEDIIGVTKVKLVTEPKLKGKERDEYIMEQLSKIEQDVKHAKRELDWLWLIL